MTEELNNQDYNLEEQAESLAENEKLMKKSPRMIITFFALFFLCIVLFFAFQTNKFFIFNLNRTFENTPSPLIAEIFSMFFFVIIIVALISYIVFAFTYYRRLDKNGLDQLDSLSSFRTLYNTADVFGIVPLFLIVVMIINGFFFSFAQVDGISMNPTFCDNDAVVIRYVEDYEAQDIVILEYDDMYLIKRLIALPGDKLVVNASGVYVNDVLIETTVPNGSVAYDLIIPEGFYYVMGDNRECSKDSRFFGLVDADNMLGKVIMRISNETCPIPVECYGE